MLGKALHNSRLICGCVPTFSHAAVRFRLRCFASSGNSNSDSGESSKDSESNPSSTTLGTREESKVPKRTSKTVDVIGEQLFHAVKDVAKDLHKDNEELRKKTQKELIEKLIEHEKETFDVATASQTNELLSDKTVRDILSDVNNMKPKPASSAANIRHARQGLVLLRREIFYQAQQSGYSADEARKIAERAVEIAEARAKAQSKGELLERAEVSKKEKEATSKKAEAEKRFYNYAYELAEKMLSPVTETLDGEVRSLNPLQPYSTSKSLFTFDGPGLGIFTKESVLRIKERSFNFWSDLDANAARVWNQSFGPRNGFEEMIEWTKKGMVWPYPINNEYLLGEEEKVGFHEHIFLEKDLQQYKLPKSGPIAHFMELVCVGLSKNSYMTVQKKRDHLKWFSNYFNKEKIEEINRLHKSEQEKLS